LAGNLIFVLGVPTALMQPYRSYGGAARGAISPGLAASNLRAQPGDRSGAIASYQSTLSCRPTPAGVKHNLGLAFLQKEQYEQAARMFEFALADCSNYQPSAGLLAGCYDRLGEEEKLAELKRVWQVEDPPEEAAEFLAEEPAEEN